MRDIRRDLLRLSVKVEKETEQVWKAFHRGLRAFIARRANNPADVDEILQEVFLRIHRRLSSVRNPGQLTSWVFQITRNTMVDYYRTAARRREIPSDFSDESKIQEKGFVGRADSDVDLSRPRRELAACLGPMIKRLPYLYREAVTLTELKGLTERDAAWDLGLSVSGVKSRVQRGRRKLREMLETCCRIELDRRKGIAGYEVQDPICQSCDTSSRSSGFEEKE